MNEFSGDSYSKIEKPKKQKNFTQVGGLHVLMAFYVAFMVLNGFMAVMLNLQEIRLAPDKGSFYLIQILTFLCVCYTGSTFVVFMSMFSRETTRHWIIMWLLLAFSTEIAMVMPIIQLGRSVGSTIFWAAFDVVEYCILMGWFWYGKRANVFYTKLKTNK